MMDVIVGARPTLCLILTNEEKPNIKLITILLTSSYSVHSIHSPTHKTAVASCTYAVIPHTSCLDVKAPQSWFEACCSQSLTDLSLTVLYPAINNRQTNLVLLFTCLTAAKKNHLSIVPLKQHPAPLPWYRQLCISSYSEAHKPMILISALKMASLFNTTHTSFSSMRGAAKSFTLAARSDCVPLEIGNITPKCIS